MVSKLKAVLDCGEDLAQVKLCNIAIDAPCSKLVGHTSRAGVTTAPYGAPCVMVD
jgi:hypothetical protein